MFVIDEADSFVAVYQQTLTRELERHATVMQLMAIKANHRLSFVQDCLRALSTERSINLRAVGQAATVLLKSSADTLYPPRAEQTLCRDGKHRDLGEPHYINRLYEFIAEEVVTTEAAKLLRAELAHIAATITRLTSLKADDLPEATMFGLSRHLLISILSFLSYLSSIRHHCTGQAADALSLVSPAG